MTWLSKVMGEFASLAEKVESGEIDPLVSYAEVKKLEKEIGNLKNQIEPIAMEEASKYPKSFEHQGFKFELRNGAVRYSYKGVPEWVEKSRELKSIEDRSKQAFIARQKGMMSATEDGEEIVLPEVNYSKDSLVVK